LEDSELLN